MKLLYSLTFLLLASYATATPNPTENYFTYQDDDDLIGKAVNMAGYQRMLTQRLAKCYLASSTKANTQLHLTQIANDIKKFEENYNNIKALKLMSKPLKDINYALDYWQDYKAILQSPHSPENIQKIMNTNTEMLTRCHQVVVSLEKYAKRMSGGSKINNSYVELAHLTNISGRQRMLSQRIMLYYLANRLKVDNSKITTILNESIGLYSKSLDELTGSLENTPEIDYKLVRLISDWRRLETLCKNLDNLSDTELSQIVSLGDLLLSEMDIVTKMYEDLIDTHVASLILGNAINKAGKQRMLTQKMAKAYLAIELGIEKEKHKKEIKKAKETFQKALTELAKYAPSKEIKEAIGEVEFLWEDYATIVNNYDDTKNNSVKILQNNTELLRACNNVVLLLKVYAKTITGNDKFDTELVGLIDKAGKQRMLSQRMVLYCMASNWDGKTDNTDRYLNKTIEDYGDALETLKRNSKNTIEIQEKLEVVSANWRKIHNACGESNVQQNILELSTILLNDMNQVTNMYESIIANLMKAEAINKAGRQRMLTQRIALNSLAINMGLDASSRQHQLKKDMLLFDKQLDELKIFLGNQSKKSSINSTIANWKKYKSLVSSNLSDAQIEELITANNTLLDNCENLMSEITGKENLSRSEELIQVAGRQRMLSQRITLYILAYKKGIQPEKCQEIIKKSIGEYKSALVTMDRASLNTPEAFNHLEKMESTISKVEKLTNQLNNVDLYQILMTSNITLTEAESLTKIYEKLALERQSKS
jgi:hypothetical protein